MTVNEHSALMPISPAALTVTVVVPAGYRAPEAWLEVTVKSAPVSESALLRQLFGVHISIRTCIVLDEQLPLVKV